MLVSSAAMIDNLALLLAHVFMGLCLFRAMKIEAGEEQARMSKPRPKSGPNGRPKDSSKIGARRK